jgi:DNA-directed RNA polymerase specialized sigma24 family protein
VSGVDGDWSRRAQAALDLLAAVVQRRTARGWEAVDLASEGLSQVQIGQRLGISKQAVSQRLHAADWHVEPAGRELASHLLSTGDGRVDRS